MQITLHLDRSDCRHWLTGLKRALIAAGHRVAFEVRTGGRAADRAVELLTAFEARLYKGNSQSLGAGKDLGADHAWALLDPAALGGAEGGAADVVIEFSGEGGADLAADLTLALDGTPGIAPAARVLVGGYIPFVAFRRRDGSLAAEGLPAIEQPEILIRALDQFTARIATLIIMALDGQTRPMLDRSRIDTSRTAISRTDMPLGGNPYLFGAKGLAAKLGKRLFPARLSAEHWRVGIRPVQGPLVVEGDTPIDGFIWLKDDGERYYADPVLWQEGGRDYLFVEEFPYASARGLIAYTELDATGTARFAPRPVLERASHLSYPFLFRHEGALYMMPENAAGGHVPLYRAKHFPDVWEEMPPLLPDIGLHDATLFAHQGAWWLMGNEAREGGSSWDCLMIFHGPSPLGPFTPHVANPVMVDARTTRPGGPVLEIGNRLVRPVQSCLGGYGRFTRFMAIEELTATSFRQRELGRMLAPLGGPIVGVHTYGRNARFEVVDALAPLGHRGGPDR